MVLAMLIDTMFAICGMLGAVYGMGREFEDIKSLHDIEKALFVCIPLSLSLLSFLPGTKSLIVVLVVGSV